MEYTFRLHGLNLTVKQRGFDMLQARDLIWRDLCTEYRNRLQEIENIECVGKKSTIGDES